MSAASSPRDPRLTPYRPDLAASSLRGQVSAERFVDGTLAYVTDGLAALRRRPHASALLDTEVLHGEVVTVFDEQDGWAWVQLHADGYVGYLASSGLAHGVAATAPTHRVKALATFVYPGEDIKAPPLRALPLNSRVAVSRIGEKFAELASGGYVATRHLGDIARFERDFVDVVDRFIGVPYLWGGKSRIGIDCSGLVQVAMHAAGLACPRDSDMQQKAVGSPVLVPDDLEGLQRGDLVFWPGHVGVMTDGVMLVHANAHHMAVVVEPLLTAAARIARDGSRISEIRRPDVQSVAVAMA